MSPANAGHNSSQGKSYGDDASPLSALLAQHLANDPGLALLVERWASLPQHIRAAILALVQTAG